MTADAPAVADPNVPERRRRGGGLKASGAVFVLLTVSATVLAYRYGEGVVFVGDRTISELGFLEVTGASAAGVAGLAVGLGAAALAIVAALLAAALSVVLAVLGVGLGLFVTLGVVTGPILLAVIVGVLIKRRYYPDVI